MGGGATVGFRGCTRGRTGISRGDGGAPTGSNFVAIPRDMYVDKSFLCLRFSTGRRSRWGPAGSIGRATGGTKLSKRGEAEQARNCRTVMHMQVRSTTVATAAAFASDFAESGGERTAARRGHTTVALVAAECNVDRALCSRIIDVRRVRCHLKLRRRDEHKGVVSFGQSTIFTCASADASSQHAQSCIRACKWDVGWPWQAVAAIRAFR